MLNYIFLSLGIVLFIMSACLCFFIYAFSHKHKIKKAWTFIILGGSYIYLASYFSYIGYISLYGEYTFRGHIVFLGAAIAAGVTYLLYFYINHLIKNSSSLYVRKKELKRKTEELKDLIIEQTKELKLKRDELIKSQNEVASSKKAIINMLEDVNEEKEKIHTILQSIGDSVVVLDSKHNIILYNSRAEDLLQLSEACIGKNFSNYFDFVQENSKKEVNPEKIFSKLLELLKTCPNASVNFPLETQVKHHGSKMLIPIHGSVSLIQDGDTKNGLVIAINDISEEKELESMKQDFIYVASHQLRTPLTGMKWFIEILQKNNIDNLRQDQKDCLVQLYESNQRLINLVNDLLDVSRLDSQSASDMNIAETNIHTIVEEIITENSAKITENKLTVKNDIHKNMRLMVDGDKIRQVLHNFISNAVKYTRTKVRVYSEIVNKDIIFSVKDDGIGIPDEQMKFMFQKFFRAKNALSSKIEGTGLGLYIVKAIVEAHGGDVGVESKENKGSRFYFRLPLKCLMK